MKYIDVDSWPRKKHFDFFKDFDYPQFNVCSNLDITKTHNFVKENNLSIFRVILFSVMKSVNNLENFRYRIRENKVILHEIIHSTFTLMHDNSLYSNVFAEYSEHICEYLSGVDAGINASKTNPELDILKDSRDDVVYLSCLPWLSFTSVSHAIKLDKTDSVPRITWGKYFEENGVIKMPLSVQVHHSLADGVHVCNYFSYMQELLNDPEKTFGSILK